MKKLMKRLCAAMLMTALLASNALALSVDPIDPGSSFSDEIIEAETPSSWAKDEISAASRLGLIPPMTGLPGYRDTITREQFAELVVRLVTKILGEAPELDSTLSFTDSENPKVLLAASAGIVNGVGMGKFDPTATTNREQIATMLYRAIGYMKAQGSADVIPNPSNIDKFYDKGEVSAWAQEGVGTLTANGIMKGTSTFFISPKDSCTVEQSILLVYRLYLLYQNP